jgi:hypothetical protein
MVGHLAKDEEHEEENTGAKKPKEEKKEETKDEAIKFNQTDNMKTLTRQTFKRLKKKIDEELKQEVHPKYEASGNPLHLYATVHLGYCGWNSIALLFSATYFFRVYGDYWITVWTKV